MSKIYKIAVVIIICTTFLNFLTFTGIGVYRTIHSFVIIGNNGMEGKPGLEIFETLDMFLMALVFLMVSLGLMKLFHPNFSWFKNFDLPWLKIENFYDLKLLIWNSVLLTLLVIFGTQLVRADGNWDWKLLIVPVAVLLFSASSKIARH